MVEAEKDLTERTDQIVHQRGMSLRDAATLLHVSPQRINGSPKSPPPGPAAKPADTTRPATSTLGGAP